MAYEKLFEKGKIGSLELKNRAVMSPMATNFANHDGTASMQLIRYYAERAKGGVGLIITEYIGVDHVYSMPAPNMLGLSQDYQVKSHEALTEAVHAYGAKIFAQLHHAGSASKSAYSSNRAISASEVPLFTGAPAPSAMTLEQIRHTQEKFLETARRAQKAGYDGIELHGAHSYLITQFLSPYYNRRSDEYGGSFENRIRFLSEIIDSIRAALGRGFPISVRISGDEMTKEIEGTLTLEDGLEIGRFLVQKGIDALNVSNGNAFNPNANCDPYSYTPGWKRHVAAAFKSALSIPIIATNTIKNPAFAEQLLEEGVSDFVALGRALLADAEFINKAQAGKEDEIRQCIGCMVCRERVLAKNIGAACAVNARTGREYILNESILNGCSRPVAVIGGGPAGMEAARVLSLRGFDVTLFEKEPELGGSLGVSAKPPHKELILELKNTMEHELALSGVNIRTYCEADHRVISDLKPEGVFLAIGAKPILPKLPGVHLPNVCFAEDVINGRIVPKGKVAVIGAGMTGLEAAEMLGASGCELTLVDMLTEPAAGVYNIVRDDILKRVYEYKPNMLLGYRLCEIFSDAICLKTPSGEISRVEAEHVVLALGVAPEQGMLDAYRAVCPQIISIGDASKPGRIYEAIRDGLLSAFYFDT